MNIRVTVLYNFPCVFFLKFHWNFKSGPGKRIVPLSNLNSPGIYLGRVFHFRFSLVIFFFSFHFLYGTMGKTLSDGRDEQWTTSTELFRAVYVIESGSQRSSGIWEVDNLAIRFVFSYSLNILIYKL